MICHPEGKKEGEGKAKTNKAQNRGSVTTRLLSSIVVLEKQQPIFQEHSSRG
jgi:hypothetical protein